MIENSNGTNRDWIAMVKEGEAMRTRVTSAAHEALEPLVGKHDMNNTQLTLLKNAVSAAVDTYHSTTLMQEQDLRDIAVAAIVLFVGSFGGDPRLFVQEFKQSFDEKLALGKKKI